MKAKKFTSLILAAIMLAAALPAFCVGAADIDSGLILRYSFDEDSASPSSVLDSSGNGFDGAVKNTEYWAMGTSGANSLSIEGGMARFPGCSKVSFGGPGGGSGRALAGAAIKIPEEVKSAIDGDYTISMWVKPDGSYSYADGMQRFFDFGIGTTDSIFLRYTPSSGDMRFQDRLIGNDESAYISTTDNINDVWSLLTVTYSAGSDTAAVYVDGREIMSGSKFKRSICDLGELTDSTYGMYLGRTQWYDSTLSDNPDYCGYMDDVRIYSRALGEADIAELYADTYHSSEQLPVSSGHKLTYKTTVGVPVELPSELTVTLSDGGEKTLGAAWDAIPDEYYEKTGKFTVRGKLYEKAGNYTVDYGCIAAATITVVSEDDAKINDGLVVYYSFDNDDSSPSSITDDSGNGFDGEVCSSNNWWNPAAISVSDGTAVFPGTKYDSGAAIKIPEGAREGLEDYTVSMWVKPDSGYSYFDSGMQRFFDFGIGTTDSIFLRYIGGSGDLRFQDRGIGSSANDASSYISVNSDALADRWALLTVTYSKENTTATVYLNGKELMSDSAKFTRSVGDISELTDSTYGMYLGRTQWNDTSNPDYCGYMDEVRLYSRALSADEVATLYKTTNPENMITVNVSYVLEDGTEIYSETAEAAEKSSYTYSAPSEYTYNGATYSLSERLSSLTISSVSSYNNAVTAVYVIKTIESVEGVSVRTYKGVAPELPDAVTVSYNTGVSEAVPVEWNEIPASDYASEGSFEVSGVLTDGTAVTASVTVYGIESVSVKSAVIVNYGGTPDLPKTASVTFSDGVSSAEPIVWDDVDTTQLSEGEEITVAGRLENYPDRTVTTTVRIVIELVTELEAVADTFTNAGSVSTNYGTQSGITISRAEGSGKAGYTRYAFFKFKNDGRSDFSSATLNLYFQYIQNGASTDYTVYAISNDWEEDTLTWNTQSELVENAELLDTVTIAPASNLYYIYDYVEFDVSDYLEENSNEEYFSFMVQSSTCAAYVSSRESEDYPYPPVISCVSEGRAATANYVCDGKTVYSETIIVAGSGSYTYTGYDKYIVGGDAVYAVLDGDYTIAEDETALTIDVEKAEYEFETPSLSAYVGENPLPSEIACTVNGEEIMFDVAFEDVSFDSAGVYTVKGAVGEIEVKATVKAYEPYYNSAGTLIGYGSVITNRYYDENGNTAADSVKVLVPVGTVYGADEALEYYPQLADAYQSTAQFTASEPTYTVKIVGTLLEGISIDHSAELYWKQDPRELIVTTAAANTGGDAASAWLIAAEYDGDGKLVGVSFDSAELPANMTWRELLSLSLDYNASAGEDLRIYLWDGSSLSPLSDVISASELEAVYPDEIEALIPRYDDVTENIRRANNYRQSTWGPTTWVNGIHTAFWDTAAYHTGNMEAYFTLGDESFKEYSLSWAEGNGWSGNTYDGDPSTWTSGYNQTQGSNAVLFGDWQTCFQSYLDLFLLDEDPSYISRAEYVMGYQISTDSDAYWWWADALFMVPPVMTKMYLATGNEGYLDALYKYYKFAAELMYDGELGIPTDADGYTTSAGSSKKSGSSYSDPDDYKHLFFRDASYVYPLNPNTGHENEKNFWARGNGWVFAGLAKILEDIPSDYENYDFFLTIYTQMAKAIADCQIVDDEGHGFWTQSMLQNYPTGSNGNDWGYETSGTAFFTYGLFWGLNSGVLDEKTYLEPALRAWSYLSEVALLDSGVVGYCQAIGANTTQQATAQSSDQPFGYGAFLLAGCEVSRWVGGVTENNAPYLRRKLWGATALRGGKYYDNGEIIDGTASFTENGTVYVPVVELAELLGFEAAENDGGYTLSNISITAELPAGEIVTVDGTAFAAADTLAAAIGKYAAAYGDVTVISHKAEVFYECDGNAIKYLNELLSE